jgi:hypothetical protein
MADIKQAARWMQESYGVQRAEFKDGPNDVYLFREDLGIVNGNLEILVFTLGDLLADDWEVAE